jgi:hypothetical protein
MDQGVRVPRIEPDCLDVEPLARLAENRPEDLMIDPLAGSGPDPSGVDPLPIGRPVPMRPIGDRRRRRQELERDAPGRPRRRRRKDERERAEVEEGREIDPDVARLMLELVELPGRLSPLPAGD